MARRQKYLLQGLMLLAAMIGITAMLFMTKGAQAGTKDAQAGTKNVTAGTKEALTDKKKVTTGTLAVPGAENTAAKMQLEKAEGRVNIADSREKAVPLIQRMRLYHGYRVDTMEKSYAWINLDSTKLAKLDAVSEAGIRKKGKNLELLLDSGNLFFYVSKPLEDDESLTIRTSTMAMGVRGTCGWVELEDENCVRVSILEGTVTVSVTDPATGERKTERISGGETAVCIVRGPYRDSRSESVREPYRDSRCEIIRIPCTKEDIPGFVLTELLADAFLREKICRESGIGLRNLTEEEAGKRLQEDEEELREIKWSYDAATKTLTISGSGEMKDFFYYINEPPWSPYKSEIATVVVEAGITRIGELAFEDCGSLTNAVIPASVTGIGDWAFDGCSSLENIYFGGTEEEWRGLNVSIPVNSKQTIHYGSLN